MKTDLQVLRHRLQQPTAALVATAATYYDVGHITDLTPDDAATVAAALRDCIDTITGEMLAFEVRAQAVR